MEIVMTKRRRTEPSTNGVAVLDPPVEPIQAPQEPETPPQPSKPRPIHKIGPVPCDKNSSAEVAIWANEVTLDDGRTFTVYNVTIHGSWRDADGTWKPLKSFRGAHLHVLLYCLQRANDWIISQRDPTECPF